VVTFYLAEFINALTNIAYGMCHRLSTCIRLGS
jgi:hypothetical protein